MLLLSLAGFMLLSTPINSFAAAGSYDKVRPETFIRVKAHESLPAYSLKGITITSPTGPTRFQVLLCAYAQEHRRTALIRSFAVKRRNAIRLKDAVDRFTNHLSCDELKRYESLTLAIALFSFDNTSWQCELHTPQNTSVIKSSACPACPVDSYGTDHLLSLSCHTRPALFSAKQHVRELLKRTDEHEAQRTLKKIWYDHLEKEKRTGIKIQSHTVLCALHRDREQNSCSLL